MNWRRLFWLDDDEASVVPPGPTGTLPCLEETSISHDAERSLVHDVHLRLEWEC